MSIQNTQPNSSSQNNQSSLQYVPEPSREYLNPRQATLYNMRRKAFINWLSTEEAKSKKGTLSKQTQENYAHRVDQIFRWVWQNVTNGSVSTLSPNHADNVVEALRNDDFRTQNGDKYSEDSKRKFANALLKWFSWRTHTHEDEEWECDVEFSKPDYCQPDALSIEERTQLRNAVMNYGSLPKYNDLSPEERSRKKALLAQQLGKPKSDITLDDWEARGQSWKFVSLIYVALDAGLRPVEVKRAKTTWYQPGSKSLHIPKQDSAKSEKSWTVALRDETCEVLELRLEERATSTKYDDTDALWLNRNSNP
ncbi:hypothetical protein [Haladaptatus sp. CMSO5]|uniref:hypothetical protein n=1 Tax=Haladaptatus sp. CMSO5 TaxID=3120514 RepID=UPI002FCE2388